MRSVADLGEERRYGSDLIVDILRDYEIPYVSFNPGATFRGLHDSLVNYAGNHPEVVECPHEKIAVGLAHGYAKASGKPMAAILHDVVGLLHGAMAIYYAYLDRVPVLLLGAGGPLDVTRRRPRVDWDHTAIVQANAIRDYVKWDDAPWGAQAVAESLARAYRRAVTEPAGPVYLCYDVTFEEDPLEGQAAEVKPVPLSVPTRLQADQQALEQAAAWLVSARRPVIVADLVGRYPERVATLVELAETLAAPVVDLNGRLNFPNDHPLFSLDREVLADADVVLALDVRDLYGCLAQVDRDERPTGSSRLPADCRVIDLGLRDLEVNGWSQHFQRFQRVDLPILADTYLALPTLSALCQEMAGRAPTESSAANREQRLAAWRSRHAAQRARWQEEARANWLARPMTPARLVAETWEVIHNEDWVLTANTVKDWARKLWSFDRPYRHPGKHLGTATQIGISLGVALAYKGTGKLVIDLQPDGDLMYDVGALWVAAHHHIPLLVVMYNNRAYYNSWNHQLKMAGVRGRNRDNAHLGTEIDRPAPDFAGLARSLGWYAEGPLEDGAQVGPALARAIRVLEEEGRPALIDAVTQPR